MMFKKLYKLDVNLILILFIFMIISFLSTHSSLMYIPSYLGRIDIKQLVFYAIGFVTIFIIYKLGNRYIYKFSFVLYIIMNILLLLLLFFGDSINGSRCWFVIPYLGSFQPSEFMKVILIIFIANFTNNFYNKKVKRSIKEEFIFLVKVLIIVVIPSILTFLEPDTGSVIMYLLITFGILVISPLRKRWFIILISIIFIILGIFLYLYFFQEKLFISIVGEKLFYRIYRILDWKNGTGMQLENSLVAIGSSGLIGHGFNRTPLYFPEASTDFIFAVYSSNFGLIGSYILISIILFLDYHLINIAKDSKNAIDKYVIIGTIFILCYQQIQNIGMTIGLLPITGITLPFISYGGSSLLSYFILMGIILNIYKDNKKFLN